MHHSSLTYQHLPEWLSEPLLAGVLTLPEAAELWDNLLLTPDGDGCPVPLHLHQAVERLLLWELEVAAPVQ